jgi:hypothetical protein
LGHIFILNGPIDVSIFLPQIEDMFTVVFIDSFKWPIRAIGVFASREDAERAIKKDLEIDFSYVSYLIIPFGIYRG